MIFLLLIIFTYIIYIHYSIYKSNVLLADDLGLIYRAKDIQQSYFEFIKLYIDSSTMSARPVSGFVTGSIIFFSQTNSQFYFLGLIFFPLSILSIYFVFSKILPKVITCLFVILYTTSMIGTAVQFSPIMLNSNIATIFYVFSIYFIVIRKNIVISLVLFVLSILSYEIFFMGLIINIIIIKQSKSKLLYIIISLMLIILYRKVVQPYFFVNSYHRDSVSNFLDLRRNIQIIIWAAKMIFRDYFIAIYRSLLNIQKLNAFEWILSLLISAGIFNLLKYYDFKFDLKKIKKIANIALVGFVFSFAIFSFSTYMPTLFGFENRNLAAIRLFFTLLIICIIFILFNKVRFRKNIMAFLFSCFVLISVLSNLGVKNSWIYANDYNNKLFKKIQTELNNSKIESGVVCVDFDVYSILKNDPNFTLREPVFFNGWESHELAVRNGIDLKNIIIQNSEREKNCMYKIFIRNQNVTLKISDL